jgi:hypothetical protein
MKKGGEEASIVTHRILDCQLIQIRIRSSLRQRGLHVGRVCFGRQRIAQGLSREHYPIISYHHHHHYSTLVLASIDAASPT